MQEKRNKRLLIVFALLTCATVLTIIFSQERSGTGVPQDYYRQTDLREVDRIVMQSPGGRVELQYQSDRWRVNDQFPADRNLIEVLFATLQQAEPKRPVATSLRDSLANYLQAQGVKVTLFRDDNEAEQFYAGGNASKTQAFFLKAGEDVPHLMVIPGYRVYVSGIFEVPARQWRDKLIFNFNWTNFRQLEVSFPNRDGNFAVEMNKNSAQIRGIAEADTARLNTFLDQLSLLTVEEYLETSPALDQLAETPPLATFRLSDIGGRTYELRVFAVENQFIGMIGKDVFAVLREDRIVPLLRSKQFFVKR